MALKSNKSALLADGSRRATLSGSPVLFKPQIAYRVRQNTNTDTPIPPDEAAGTNPPDGAILDYMLASAAAGPVTLEILDTAGRLVRRYSSDDPVERADPANAPVPVYWYRPPLQGADVTPTTQLVAAVGERRAALGKVLAQWTALKADARSPGVTP